MSSQVKVPYAILNPLASGVKLRRHLYLKKHNLTPILVQTVIRNATKDSLTPIVIDLETTSALAHDRTAKVVAISLASSHSVLSINVKDKHDVWLAILNYLHASQLPLIAHNAVFDYAWMLRDLNPNAKYYSDYKLLNFVGCTYGMYRHLASEGFAGQKWSLDYAQKTLLNIESNKRERNKRLVEQGIIKRQLPSEILNKLFGNRDRDIQLYTDLVDSNGGKVDDDTDDEGQADL